MRRSIGSQTAKECMTKYTKRKRHDQHMRVVKQDKESHFCLLSVCDQLFFPHFSISLRITPIEANVTTEAINATAEALP